MHPYGCHNKPRPTAAVTIPAQNGWATQQTMCNDLVRGLGYRETRVAVVTHVQHTMSTDCQYDKSATDARCAGCHHAKQGAV